MQNTEILINIMQNISLIWEIEEISHNIFALLRKADKCNAELILVEGVETTGLGLAIMNRLIRACAHEYIKT